MKHSSTYSNGCEYCTDYTNKVQSMHEDDEDSWFSLYEHYMEVIIKGKEITSFKINYCPMCGKFLNR